MRVPFVDLAAQDAPLRDEIRAAVDVVLTKGNYILGDQVGTFETAFAGYCGVNEAVGVSSGLAALELILRGYGVGPGDEVIVPALTFVGTASAVALVGATPVVVDVDDDLNILPAAVDRAISSRTKAIIAVHLYGRLAKVDELVDLAERHQLKLIEDSAQAHGASLLGRRAGSFGDAAAFSFYPSKNLGASGDAGAIVTNDTELASRLRALRNCGQHERNVHELMPCNGRMDTMQAAILHVRLKHLEAWNKARRAVASAYERMLPSSSVCLPPVDEHGRESVWHLYVIRSTSRDSLRSHLTSRGIDTAIHYPIPVHLQPYFAYLGHKVGDFPNAESACRSILSLPMHPNVNQEQVEFVAKSIEEFSGGPHLTTT